VFLVSLLLFSELILVLIYRQAQGEEAWETSPAAVSHAMPVLPVKEQDLMISVLREEESST